MKVYRALPYIDTTKLIKSRYNGEGENFEGSNLLNFGLCSPSFEYLDNTKNPNANLNTFTVNGLAKYFYVSIFDCLNWAYNIINRFSYLGIDMNFLIWEVDLPDHLVKKYLGTGKYSSIRRIEAKIPYDELYGYLASNIDINLLDKIKGFFNKYYSWQSATLPDLVDLLKILPNIGINNPDIVMTSENKLYKKVYSNLCFLIYMPYKIMYDSDTRWAYDAYNLALASGFNKDHLKRARQIYADYENWPNLNRGDFNDYLVKQMPFYEEENEGLKKVLTKSGLNFTSR